MCKNLTINIANMFSSVFNSVLLFSRGNYSSLYSTMRSGLFFFCWTQQIFLKTKKNTRKEFTWAKNSQLIGKKKKPPYILKKKNYSNTQTAMRGKKIKSPRRNSASESVSPFPHTRPWQSVTRCTLKKEKKKKKSSQRERHSKTGLLVAKCLLFRLKWQQVAPVATFQQHNSI